MHSALKAMAVTEKPTDQGYLGINLVGPHGDDELNDDFMCWRFRKLSTLAITRLYASNVGLGRG
jgi:hypothetical protein